MSSDRRQRGLTLIEMIVFIVIISVGVTSLLSLMNVNNRSSADPVMRKQALMVAESLLEEVQQAAFTYCEPASAEAGTAEDAAGCGANLETFGQAAPVPPQPYDNVNDYVPAAAVWTEAFTVGGEPVGADLKPLASNNYKAEIMITPVALNGIGSAGTSANTEVLRITVRVSYGTAAVPENVTLDAYRTRYAPKPL